MKTCPECGIKLKDEYQFCPEDGAPLGQPTPATIHDDASMKAQPASAVVLYCPACAAEYPLTFSECPVHHTALTTHGIPSLVDAPREREQNKTPAAGEPRHRRLHLVSPDAHAQVAEPATPTRLSGIEAYEQTLEDLARPAVGGDAGERREELSLSEHDQPDEARRYRVAAMAVAVTLALLALMGIYAMVSNGSRKPAPAKNVSAKNSQPQQTITVQTPQAALDYQEPAAATAPTSVDREATVPPNNEVSEDTRARARRGVEDVPSSPQRGAEMHTPVASREPATAPPPRPVPPVAAQSTVPHQPSATELVLPRGTFGLVAARLTNVRAARTSSGYRYELTFHLADQAGHATQWERLAIVTRSMSGATRQQQIPFYHRLGADGTMSFTVSVEMPGRAPADWQGRIICTSIGSDSTGKSYRASFGANVSPN